VWNILVSHENLSNQTAYNIVKTIFDKREDMIACTKRRRISSWKTRKPPLRRFLSIPARSSILQSEA